MKRFILLSVLFLFFAMVSHAQMVKPNRVQVQKKSVSTVAVGKNEVTKTNKSKLPYKKAVVTRISIQANKKRNK